MVRFPESIAPDYCFVCSVSRRMQAHALEREQNDNAETKVTYEITRPARIWIAQSLHCPLRRRLPPSA